MNTCTSMNIGRGKCITALCSNVADLSSVIGGGSDVFFGNLVCFSTPIRLLINT